MRTSSYAAYAGIAVLAAAVAACSKTSVPTIGTSVPVLPSLHTTHSFGSTVDAVNADQHPAGIVIEATGAKIVLALACNNADAAGTANTGTTIESLPSPIPSATPFEFSQSASLQGCTSLAMSPNNTLIAAAPGAGDIAVVQGSSATPIPTTAFSAALPLAVTYAASSGTADTFYASTGSDGGIYRLTTAGGTFTTGVEIATGFPVGTSVVFGGGSSATGPVGPDALAYDSRGDTLYVADSAIGDVTAITGVSTIAAGGLVRSGNAFTGASAASATILAQGLGAPNGVAVLFNGDLVVSSASSNSLSEISPAEGVVATRVVDAGACCAIGGVTSIGTTRDSTTIMFGDANSNTVQALSR